MRLAIVRQDYHPDGTTESVTERALEALLERNVAVSLYTRSWPQTRLQLVEPRVFDPFHLGDLWRDWGFARAVCRDVRRSQPSLVESHERLLCCDVYRATEGVHAVWLEERARRASPFARLQALVSPHDRYRANIERRLYSSPWLRAVICNSAMVKDEIRERFAVPEAKLHVIPNPVDHDTFHPGLRSQRPAVLEHLRIDPAATVFLLAAADFARADLASAIDAFARLGPPAHFIALGDDPEAVRYVARAKRRGVVDRVTFARGLFERRTYYGAADAFVLPSIYDPSPDLALEAMACALPVITSSKSGAASLVLQHDAGLVVAAGDIPALSAHMASLRDPALRARFAANARRAVLPLSASAVTLQQVLLYRDLLASPGPPTLVVPPGGTIPDSAGATP